MGPFLCAALVPSVSFVHTVNLALVFGAGEPLQLWLEHIVPRVCEAAV